MDEQISAADEGRALVENRTRLILVVSVTTWLLLMLSNLLSIIIIEDQYHWPNGWFHNDYMVVFAIAGVVLNMLLAQRNLLRDGDWHEHFFSVLAFRILQATIYTAVVYQLGRFFLPFTVRATDALTEGECTMFLSQCISVQSSLFLVISFFIGLTINRIENELTGFLRVGSTGRDEKRIRKIKRDFKELEERLKDLNLLGLTDEQRKAYEEELDIVERSLKQNEHSRAELLIRDLRRQFAAEESQNPVGPEDVDVNTDPPTDDK